MPGIVDNVDNLGDNSKCPQIQRLSIVDNFVERVDKLVHNPWILSKFVHFVHDIFFKIVLQKYYDFENLLNFLICHTV